MNYKPIFFFITLLFSLNIYAEENKCKLKIAYEQNPPLIYNEANKIVGIEAELISKIISKTNCVIEWINLPWHHVLASLKSGDVDIATTATYADERLLYSNFTIPYREEIIKLYVRKNDIHTIQAKNLNEFLENTKLKIGYNNSYKFDQVTNDLINNPQYQDRFEAVIDSSLNFYKLQAHLLDGIIMDSITANHIIRKNNWINKFDVYEFNICTNPLSLMVSKKNDPNGYYFDILNNTIRQLYNEE
ncbi:MAG: substrate-binding periplasmic protein [Alphaproteobacteria bacterium]